MNFRLLFKSMTLTLLGLSTALSATLNYAYITNQGSNTITPLDLSTNMLQPAITVGQHPHDIVITPDGSYAYVVEFSSNNLAIVDLRTNTPITTSFTDPSLNGPNHLAITKDGLRLFVTNQPGKNVVSFDISNPTNPIFLYNYEGLGGANTIAIHPSDTYALVTNISGGVNYIDIIHTPPTITPIQGTFGNPLSIAITPDGTKAYVSNFTLGSVTPIDLTVYPPVGLAPITDPLITEGQKIAITPDGKHVFMISSGSPYLVDIDTTTNTVVANVQNIQGNGVQITPDGQLVYATNDPNNTIIPVSVATPNTSNFPPITGNFSNPTAIAMVPDQAPNANFTVTYTPKRTVNFDASFSNSPVGVIVKYHWNFGDGYSTTTSSATTKHQYNMTGSYDVTLTVTNQQGTSTTQVFTGQMISNNGGPNAQVTKKVFVVK